MRPTPTLLTTPLTTTRCATPLAALVATLVATALLTACSSDEEPGPPTPVVEVDDLSPEVGGGGETSVALDTVTLEQLTEADTRTTPFGTAKIEDGAAVFEITGGHLTVFEPDAAPLPVVGQVQHEGSGLTFTRDGRTVTIGNFDVDPTVDRVYGDVAVDGSVTAYSHYLLRLDTSAGSVPSYDAGQVVLAGARVYPTEEVATLVAETLGTGVLDVDTPLGTLTTSAIVAGS